MNNMKVFLKDFWKAAGIRAVRTMSQCALSLIPAAAMVTSIDWLVVLGSAATAGIISLLTSLATGLPEVSEEEEEDIE